MVPFHVTPHNQYDAICSAIVTVVRLVLHHTV